MTVSTTTRKAGAAAGAVAAAGATAAAAKALLDRRGDGPKYELQADESVDDGIKRIAAGRATSALAHLNGESDADDDAAAIHETRKDIKKLRSVLRLVREPLGEDLYQRENERFREAANLLGGARDAEVKLGTLAALRRRSERDYPDGGLAALVQELEDERDRLSEDLVAAGDGSPRATAIARIEAGLDAISDWGLDGEGFGLLAAGLRRSYARGRKLYAATLEEPSGHNVHEWRKRAKDLRYHLRLLREARKGKLGDAVDAAHELTDHLGDHHDLEVLREDVAARPAVVGEPSRSRLEELIERCQAQLADQATAIGERLYADKPKRFLARIEGYFTEWR